VKMQWEDRIGRRLKLQDMHILLTTVQCGSMGKAATQLAISQPVVSRSIATLERALGVRLLDRSRGGVEPTMYGRALLTHGLAAFNELKQGVKAIESLADPTVGELRIGSTDPMAAGMLAVMINRLSRKYPRLSFDIKLGFPPDMQAHELHERSIDLMIGRLPSPVPAEDTDVEVLYQDRSFVVAGAGNPWTRRRKIELAELINEPWTHPPLESLPGLRVTDAFRSHNLEVPPAVVTVASVQLQSTLLATGRFLTVLPQTMLYFASKRLGLKALPVKLLVPPWPVGITTLKGRMLNPIAQLFIACARDIAKPLANSK
jgi:DNA-binding transcriptional LysR family regulator